ncbi:uncharacterized protein [Cardiocondyla obscurior]|uniref:uncharacterized protein n=1 Tax=Cardiocondyla obscurior TaxID=286306 RepID=UPI00396581B3
MSSDLAKLLGIKGMHTATALAGVGDTVVKTVSSTAHISIAADAQASLKAFWEIEEIPQRAVESEEDRICEEHFKRTHSRDAHGRYIVRIPFKVSLPLDIGETRHIAEATLKRIEARMAQHVNHRELYVDFMKEYRILNHMTRLSNLPRKIVDTAKPIFLPHHPVIRADSQTTKLRVVFNASAKTNKNLTLNE